MSDSLSLTPDTALQPARISCKEFGPQPARFSENRQQARGCRMSHLARLGHLSSCVWLERQVFAFLGLNRMGSFDPSPASLQCSDLAGSDLQGSNRGEAS